MNNVFYNLDKINRISITDKIIEYNFKYLSKKKFFGLTIRREGWYHRVLSYELISDLDLIDYKKKYLFIDNIAYQKPICQIILLNDYSHNFYFNTLEEATSKAEEIKNMCNNKWLEINIK